MVVIGLGHTEHKSNANLGLRPEPDAGQIERIRTIFGQGFGRTGSFMYFYDTTNRTNT